MTPNWQTTTSEAGVGKRQCHRIGVLELDRLIGAKLLSRDVEHRPCRVNPDHFGAAMREVDSERTCTAPDVDDRTRPDGIGERNVEVVVPPIDALGVVHRRESRILGP